MQPPPETSVAHRLGLTTPPLYVIDGAAYIFRSFYALPDLSRSDGHPTNALFLLLRMLFALLKSERPKHIAFFMDGPGPTFRHEAFADYKANRSATPEGLLQQVPVILEAVELLGVKTYVSQGCEADDCIATLAASAKADVPVVIVGTDKDLKQLLDARVAMWDPMNPQSKLTTLEDFQGETGLSPAQWPDVQALVGDSSDNIPGVPGIGPKTAYGLFKAHPHLEDVQANLDSLKPAVQKKLAEHMDKTFLYRDLTTLKQSGCVELPWTAFARNEFDADKVADFLETWELRSLAREFKADPALGSNAPTLKVEELSLFASPGNDAQTAAAAKTAEATPVQTEADLPYAACKELGLVQSAGAITCWLDEQPYHIPLSGEGVHPERLIHWLVGVAAIFCSDLKALLRALPGLMTACENCFDVGLGAYLLNSEERDYGLPHLMDRYGPELSTIPTHPAAQALALGTLFQKRLREAGMADLMTTLEGPLIPVLASMEARGITIDRAAFNTFLQDVTKELETLEQNIHQMAGHPFNIRSSLQLAKVLFEELELKPAGKTPGGKASTSQEVLEKLAGSHEIVQAILGFRKLEKLRSTYLEPLPRLADGDGVIRTTFNQLAAATGRLSSVNPNLQNIPIRGEHGTRMRGCFMARPGHLLVAADYSQIELRVLAHMSGDPTLLDAFNHGADIHARTAALLYEKAQEDVTPDERRNAKTINFGLIYGMGPQKLSQELMVSLKEAKAFITKYFEKLSRLKAFYEEVETQAKQDGFVTTLAHRRRLLPQIHSQNPQMASQARRQAVNTRIQGSAADIIKLAMLAVHRDTMLNDLGAAMLLQVHDELVLEVPVANVDAPRPEAAVAAGERLQSLMSGVLEQPPFQSPLDVPLVVDWGFGPTWAVAH